eukprot:891176-Rhodomonas_salina.1
MGFVVTSGVQSGSLTEGFAYSFDSAVVVRGSLINTESPGSVMFMLSGALFGMTEVSSAFRVGTTSCEASEWTSDTSVKSQAAQGASASLRLTVSNNVRLGSTTNIVSYNIPSATGGAGQNVAGTGSASLTLSGGGF